MKNRDSQRDGRDSRDQHGGAVPIAQRSAAPRAAKTKRAARRRSPRARLKQNELRFRSWGGARKGAGRKPKGERARVPHVARPKHPARFPLLITSRLLPGLPSLRRTREAARVVAAIVEQRGALQLAAGAGESPRFQVVHYSIQSNHLHLLVESSDRTALTSGMRGLLVRIARALNRLWNRAGQVFADRFHERELRKPLQVRNALVYVLRNLRKHGISLEGPDPLSSGPEFDGWDLTNAPEQRRRSGWSRSPDAAGTTRLPTDFLRAARSETLHPTTWLLNVGWRRHGLIQPCESPASR